MNGPFFAHSGSQPDHSDWQLLADHLAEVANLAEAFMRDAVPANSEYVAMAAASGWLHDLGKYRPQFQNMIRGLPVARTETWHKQAGAARCVDAKNPVLAFAIAGHHGGLPAMTRLKEIANGPSGRSVADAVWPTAVSECPALNNLELRPVSEPDRLSGELMTRAVFSCLVDADWTDTANHARQTSGLSPEQPAPALQADEWLQRVLKFIGQKADACREAFVAEARADVLRCALQRADDPPGIMSLTVPTGGGKTLSGLAFALRHAARHQLRRIIYVAPYLSILEQNADVMRAALGFGRNCPEVFEHHSLSEPFEPEATANDSSVDASKSSSTERAPDSDNDTRPLSASRRAENWDAPIVMTTSVQFFESLFANRPGSCRKLHNIARSVILLDECQTLPPGLVAPTCGMLGQLVERLGCSVVLCTATQPALQHPAMPERLKQVVEIAPPDLKLFERLRRVEVSWPHQNDASLSWPEVAQRMASERASLCIVNTRRAARELFAELRKCGTDAFHLSTGMCPQHRAQVLSEVKQRLERQLPCCLVSTQLVEAGVDIDFPVVLRELAPLEAVIQAAGRCNREGRLNGSAGEPGGRVIVFRSEDGQLPPDAWYSAGRDVLTTRFLNRGTPPDIANPADIQSYFEQLYWLKGPAALDQFGIQAQRAALNFPEVAQRYRLIRDDSVPVVVATWSERAEEIESLLQTARRDPSRAQYRRLIPFQVNLRRHELSKLPVCPQEEIPGVLVWSGEYDLELGFSPTLSDSALII